MTIRTADFAIRVEACEGHRGEPTPRRFFVGRRRVEVAEVVDCWLGRERRYFKVRGDDGDLYILRHEAPGDHWELTLFASAGSPLLPT
ncbi:MAG TPA: hypothetical protein VGV61_10225 [Thermoanaerobaculia bacterium]|jgi:hypothetical protein|nr:hypothetical protein [Thermoanaerobaculia bacterium]